MEKTKDYQIFGMLLVAICLILFSINLINLRLVSYSQNYEYQQYQPVFINMPF